MEEVIEKTKKENLELIKQVRNLKNAQVTNSKELEVCNINKKYPNQINIYTDEIKNQVAKKHEYFNKLIHNKRSLSNMKTLLTRTVNNYQDLIVTVKTDKNNSPVIKVIEETINTLTSELAGTEEEILNKLCGQNSDSESASNGSQVPRQKSKTTKTARNVSPQKRHNILPSIQQNQRGQSPVAVTGQEYKGIFNKYEYLSSRDRHSLPHYMVNSNNAQKVKKAPITKPKITATQGEVDEDIDRLDFDYDNTSDSDYANLFKKKEQLVKIYEVLLKNLKEIDKLYDKKSKDLRNTVEHNTKKLKMLQQVVFNIIPAK